MNEHSDRTRFVSTVRTRLKTTTTTAGGCLSTNPNYDIVVVVVVVVVGRLIYQSPGVVSTIL